MLGKGAVAVSLRGKDKDSILCVVAVDEKAKKVLADFEKWQKIDSGKIYVSRSGG